MQRPGGAEGPHGGFRDVIVQQVGAVVLASRRGGLSHNCGNDVVRIARHVQMEDLVVDN